MHRHKHSHMYSLHRFTFECAHIQTTYTSLPQDNYMSTSLPGSVLFGSPNPHHGLLGVSLFWFVFYSHQDPGDLQGAQ